MKEPEPPQKWKRQSIAIVFILIVDILWVSSSELTQTIFHNASYEHPYFLSYFNTSLFSLYALCFIPLFYHTFMQKYQTNHVLQQKEPLPPNYKSINHQNSCNQESNSFAISSHSCCITSIPSDKLSITETLKLSIIFCIIWFSMTYTFNLSLNLTSVASNSIISSMSGPFCLILSRCFLSKYELTKYNIMGVIITTLGSSFIGYLDSHKSDSIGGDILAIISALIYSVYVIGIKYKIGDETRVNMFLFFGFIGLLNFVILWPGILILNGFELEMFEMPSKEIWVLLTINGLLTIFSDYFWAQAILLSNPVIATVGLSLMMPLAIMTDQIFRGITYGYLYYIGAVCVWIGFILVNIDMSKDNEQKRLVQNVEE